MSDKIDNYADFWLFYVWEHSNKTNQTLHFIGTVLGSTLVIFSLAYSNFSWLIAAPVVGYGLAWVGHFVIQKNRPATFRYPLWSFLSDFRMCAYLLLGRMDEELERAVARQKAHRLN